MDYHCQKTKFYGGCTWEVFWPAGIQFLSHGLNRDVALAVVHLLGQVKTSVDKLLAG